LAFSAAIEIKSTNNNTIAEKALRPHQKLALLAAKEKGITFKIPDSGVRLPFDAFFLKESNAYVIACFPKHGLCLVFDVSSWSGARFDDEALFKIEL
jgi:hypothetical protein